MRAAELFSGSSGSSLNGFGSNLGSFASNLGGFAFGSLGGNLLSGSNFYGLFNYCGSFFSSVFSVLVGAGEHRHAESNGEHKKYFFHLVSIFSNKTLLFQNRCKGMHNNFYLQ